LVGGEHNRTRSDERRAEWLARVEAWTDRPLTALSLLLIVVLLAPYLFNLSNESEEMLVGIDYLIWGAFAADLVVKVAIAPDRRRYLTTHWLDVLLVVLPLLRPLRIVRSVRAVRALRAGRAAVAVARVLVGIRRMPARKGVRYVLTTGLIVVLAAGSLVTVLEEGHPDANIQSLPDGIWWAVTTVTTVGYGDTFPRSPAGRGVGIALMLIGIGLFGALTASLAAVLIQDSEDEVTVQLREMNERLRRLEERLAARDAPGNPADDQGQV
jgi:voltage-gated potassium channel